MQQLSTHSDQHEAHYFPYCIDGINRHRKSNSSHETIGNHRGKLSHDSVDAAKANLLWAQAAAPLTQATANVLEDVGNGTQNDQNNIGNGASTVLDDTGGAVNTIAGNVKL